jgi:hypothetical protein
MKVSTISKSNGIVESDEASGTAIGDRDLETIALEPSPNSEADMRIIINN